MYPQDELQESAACRDPCASSRERKLGHDMVRDYEGAEYEARIDTNDWEEAEGAEEEGKPREPRKKGNLSDRKVWASLVTAARWTKSRDSSVRPWPNGKILPIVHLHSTFYP